MTVGGDIRAETQAIKVEIERRLAQIVPAGASGPGRLREAMAYSLLAPAKRVRAILTVLAAEHVGGTGTRAASAAVALELVHAASLVLDDLPAMDDAMMRRGKATSHRVFGEATAMLSSIALMNQAFGVVAADRTLSAEQRVAITAVLARSIGLDGLTGGQELDLLSDRSAGGAIEAIERTHTLKTGALFAAAAEAGGLAGGGEPATVGRLREFGQSIGLAFQAYDDLLDAYARSDAIGKDVARDAAKSTIVSCLGREAAEARAAGHVRAALASLDAVRAAGGDSALRRYVGHLIGSLGAPIAEAARTKT